MIVCGLSPSCSLLHSPYDLEVETQLQANKPELYQWLAFTLQKIQELRIIKTALEQGREAVQAELAASQAAADARKNSREIHRTCVAERLANLPKMPTNVNRHLRNALNYKMRG